MSENDVKKIAECIYNYYGYNSDINYYKALDIVKYCSYYTNSLANNLCTLFDDPCYNINSINDLISILNINSYNENKQNIIRVGGIYMNDLADINKVISLKLPKLKHLILECEYMYSKTGLPYTLQYFSPNIETYYLKIKSTAYIETKYFEDTKLKIFVMNGGNIMKINKIPSSLKILLIMDTYREYSANHVDNNIIHYKSHVNNKLNIKCSSKNENWFFVYNNF